MLTDKKQIIAWLRSNYVKGFDVRSSDSGYVVDVNGSVSLSASIIKYGQIPVKFGRVAYDFDIGHNMLTSLAGCPEEVGGNFFCGFNLLTSLEGGPMNVAGIYNCSQNKLSSLKHCAKSVDSLVFESNLISSLDDLPHIKSDLLFSGNMVSSLRGCPEYLLSLDCSNNKLVNLEHAPISVVFFNCAHNKITSLIGCPKMTSCEDPEIDVDIYPSDFDESYFSFENNCLTNLVGAPKYLEFMDCRFNHLTTLHGAPIDMSHCNAAGNRLVNFNGLDASLACHIDVTDNPISSLDGLPNNVTVEGVNTEELAKVKSVDLVI